MILFVYDEIRQLIRKKSLIICEANFESSNYLSIKIYSLSSLCEGLNEQASQCTGSKIIQFMQRKQMAS